MGPKKEKKESISETKNNGTLSIDDPINTENWKCVLTLGVEKTGNDCYALREFMEECVKGSRQEISLINYESTVLKILNDFAVGEVPYKYKLLLNFSPLFEEAAEFYKNRSEIPPPLLAKLVKGLLFHIREESLIRIHNATDKFTDPIKVMAARPSNLGENDKKKDVGKKGGNGLKVRPPSITKQDTNLLKRGERAKDDQCIDDAPRNSFFDHYVLLTGFYNPDFPLELLKEGLPLHGVLCIDTSRSGMKWETSVSINKFSRRNTDVRTRDIHYFWDAFLKKIWDPQYSSYFRDTVFQMYVPRKLLCEKGCRTKYIYKELSYLMYDLSDLKRKLANYLNHIRFWDVTEKGTDAIRGFVVPDFLPNECVTVPIVLQCMIDAVCNSRAEDDSSFSVSTNIKGVDSFNKGITSSMKVNPGSCFFGTDWNVDLEQRGDPVLLDIYHKIKELDVLYDLDRGTDTLSEHSDGNSSGTVCAFEVHDCGENMREALESSDTMFHLLWSKYKIGNSHFLPVDYCLYARLMTKVFCSYEDTPESSITPSLGSASRSIDFENIDNIGTEMRKPHFTVTDGSRSIVRSFPYNMKSASRDFFCPEEFKVVSPEKLKASSAPQFRVTPGLKVEALYTSEIFPSSLSKNPYENLRGFIEECLFIGTNGFDCLEFYSKHKLLLTEKENWGSYNCTDSRYCSFNDSILLMVHNRKDDQNFQHETFNQKLRTVVGLRDFFDYVLEDEEEWLTLQEESYQAKVMLSNRVLESNSLRDFEDSDFWLTNSLKYTTHGKTKSERQRSSEIKIAVSSLEKIVNPNFRNMGLHTGYCLDDELEGFDMGDLVVQYSGLKTVFYSGDCVVAVTLVERLYGNQDLGVHVTQSCHTLHLHSYVCPEPHILDPYTFHLVYSNGIIVAFSRRFLEKFDDIQESISTTSRKTRIIDPKNPTLVKDDSFWYDLAASLPNGLCFRTVRKVVEPCYIKQYYVGKKGNKSLNERSRLFLPNGIVIVMLIDDRVTILKPNTSVITAHLKDFTRQPGGGKFSFSSYEVISEEGMVKEIKNGSVVSSFRHRIFRNKHWDTNQTFFRRPDGTTYMLESDGSLCVEFEDGTKMWTSVLMEDKKLDDEEFVFVHLKIVVEHPDYATIKCNTGALELEIMLPGDSSITVNPNGHYFVDIDKTTNLAVEEDLISMNHFSDEGEIMYAFTANLSVFDKKNARYCQLKDNLGKTFVVEGNSNCYVVETESGLEDHMEQTEQSEFVASTDLQIRPPACRGKRNNLYRENKYFVVKRDLSAMEILHVDDVNEVLNNLPTGSVVFTQTLPGKDIRCFVLISEAPGKKFRKWQVGSLLPKPKCGETSSARQTSSTYGVEISSLWMHPLPKKKKKFVIPSRLTCRVFIETKETKLSPPVGNLDCFFCEMDEVTKVEHTNIPPNAVDRYLIQLAHDNQQILKEMYALSAYAIIHRRRLNVDHMEKLQKYLESSRDLTTVRDFYKKSIRFRIIPKYFDYSYGKSWAIINEIVQDSLPSSVMMDSSSDTVLKTDTANSSSRATDVISDKEIEYNLTVSEERSFSSLSYRSTFSAESAPPALATFPKCKIQPAKKFFSSPEIPYREGFTSDLENIEEITHTPCEIREDELETFERTERTPTEKPPFSLEDLMFLGFV